MTEVMLDLETASTRPNAAILSIGAVKFKRTGPVIPLDKMNTFYVKIDLNSCLENGLEVDESTMAWWDQQDNKIREEAFSGITPLGEALVAFREWFGYSQLVWGNGDDFDCTILGEAFRRCGLDVPWKFWNTRDCRTAYELGRIQLRNFKGDQQHHALYDCYYQIKALKQAVRNLRPS